MYLCDNANAWACRANEQRLALLKNTKNFNVDESYAVRWRFLLC